jgi:HEAT repeat protein
VSELPLSLSGDDASEVRQVDHLAQQGASGVRPLIDRLTHPSWAVRRAVVAALARIGTPAVEPLCRLILTRRDHEDRLAAAVDALAASRGDADAEVIALAATDHPAPVVCDAAQILGRRKSLAGVPTLERLTRHSDDNVAVAAVEALGRIGSGAGADALMAMVASRAFFRTFPAIEVLGRSGDPRVVPLLIELLDDPLYAMEAARALGMTGDTRAVAPLVALLQLAHESLVRAIAVALAELHRREQQRFGSAALVEQPIASPAHGALIGRLLLGALADADEPEQAAIALLLGWRVSQENAVALFDLLAGAPAVSQVALASLRRLGRAIDPLLAARLGHANSAQRLTLLPLVSGRSTGLDNVSLCLEDFDPAVRTAACEALARSGDTARVGALFRLLGDEDVGVAQAASAAIQSLGSPETERLALQAAVSPDARVRRAGLRIVSYFGYPNGLAPLLAALEDSDDKLRDVAIAGLVYFDDARALAALLSAAQHESPKTRAAAVRALGHAQPGAQTHACLLQALRDTDAWVRYYACQSLGKLRDDAATDAIVALVDDPAGQVRVAVIDALAQMQSDAAAQALERAAASSNADVRRAALVGLGVARRPASVPALIDALSAPDPATRLVALSALAGFDAPPVLPALRRAAGDADLSVASAAIGFLGNLPGPPATDTLIELLDRPGLREAAITALARPIEGRVGGILAALENHAGAAHWLVAALARMGRADADAALVAALKAPSAHARRAAAGALAERRTPDASSALAAAATDDLDPEVRRIALMALAALQAEPPGNTGNK